MPRFDLNLLGALHALLLEKSVTRAAQRIGVTQPTMSGMLQRLRYQLDDEILLRNGRSMELTHYGETLLAPVIEALEDIDQLTRTETSFNPTHSERTFSIMMGDYCAAMLAPRLMARLATCAPRVRLDIQALNSPMERMASGDLDLCITTRERFQLDPMLGGEALESRHLYADEFVCVVAQSHVLADRPTLDRYMTFPHVGLKFAGNLTTIAEHALRQLMPDYRFTFTVAESTLIPAVVVASEAIGIMPLRLASRAARQWPVRHFAPPFAIPPIRETLLWHARHAGEASHAWMRDLIGEEAAHLHATDGAD